MEGSVHYSLTRPSITFDTCTNRQRSDLNCQNERYFFFSLCVTQITHARWLHFISHLLYAEYQKVNVCHWQSDLLRAANFKNISIKMLRKSVKINSARGSSPKKRETFMLLFLLDWFPECALCVRRVLRLFALTLFEKLGNTWNTNKICCAHDTQTGIRIVPFAIVTFKNWNEEILLLDVRNKWMTIRYSFFPE